MKHKGELHITINLESDRLITGVDRPLKNLLMVTISELFSASDEIDCVGSSFEYEYTGVKEVSAQDLADALLEASELIVILNSQNDCEETERYEEMVELWRDQNER